jgi:peptidoglycan/LPS O-acetylase OafA/YrhL
MKPGFSIWLDVLRITATLTVVISHLAYPRFTDGTYQWVRDQNLGSDAVILFFVISGLVIARAAERDATLPHYAFNRATRLYSVMVPALLLTWLFDRVGLGIDPAAYPDHYFQPLPLATFLLRGLSFSNEWLIADPVRLGTNGPLWSLSYEVAYYVFLGTAVYLSGARRLVLLCGFALVVGPNAVLLIPAWLMGVAIWRLIRDETHPRLSPRTALALAVLPPVAYGLARGLSLPPLLLHLTEAVLPASVPIESLRFSNEFLWNGLIGALFALHVYAMSQLLSDWRHGARAIRWLAQASFSVYVTHYPALHLADAILPADIWGRALWLLLWALAVGLAFAQVFERPLDRWRRLLRPTQRVPG